MDFTTRSLKQAIFKDFSIHVHLRKCIKAKNLALEKLHGNLNEQYTKLYDYLAELKSSNHGITTILQLDERVFKRLHICMQAMKDGFKAGCRPIIRMDGSLTLWRQEGKEDQGITFVQVRFCGYGNMYKQWGGYALFWSMLDSFKLMRCCGS
ncbi:hypothetical protein GQ457_15G020020 [Hibiscus cannabinus]